MNYYLAVDIGASSGRHILGWIENGKLQLEEIYRFENLLIEKDGQICWDIENLWNQVKNGIVECGKRGIKPVAFGIDTWAVDFVLLDESGKLIGNSVAYRDSRTDKIMDEVFNLIPKEELYGKTGIQFQKFNTVYQLMAIKKSNPEYFEKAKDFLMIPDYINYLLTGVKVNEYTNATSTQLVNAKTKEWDFELIEKLGIKTDIFKKIVTPSEKLGNLRKELAEEFGFDMEVIAPATHDTGSAFIASPITDGKTVLMSSGTWSLMGVELSEPNFKSDSLACNFTNEGGAEYKYRFLKNIMGLWIIQEVRRDFGNAHSFAEIVEAAKLSTYFKSTIDVNDDRFLKPKSMIQEIKKACTEKGQQFPVLLGEIAYCVFNSLSKGYRESVNEIERLTGTKYESVNVFGGGCQNNLLNQMIAEQTGKTVYAGPVEATAIGNIVTQMIGNSEIKDISEARKIIGKSFDIETFKA